MRWDEDTRGIGVASGEAFAPGVRTLLEELAREGWVAEQPEAHLLPHIERAAARTRLRVVATSFGDDGVFDVELASDLPGRHPELHEDVYLLIGSFAETSTSVIERRRDGVLEFEVATGLAPEQTHFSPHGHLVRLRLAR